MVRHRLDLDLDRPSPTALDLAWPGLTLQCPSPTLPRDHTASTNPTIPLPSPQTQELPYRYALYRRTDPGLTSESLLQHFNFFQNRYGGGWGLEALHTLDAGARWQAWEGQGRQGTQTM